ncbi:tetratricopeptide repeat protein [Marinihelvus fidelis]|uniref:Tetratricopeptide repeat protein n=1 Tax=Marinihelvus fidelis TaxID=2613842 RepID=A0A5N0T554_9GAMM|nr:tetratricopeptide repeat protein [Marinihelvus fidelis]KAA9130185.1 tetratricopeptide repeat protein [Marinihelvus fidelis]
MKELRERRVLPTIGVYVAGCWVAIEILDRLTDRYELPPYVPDLVFWGLFSLVPSVALVAWSYGRPGKDTATRAQKIGVPINLVATAGLLLGILGSNLGTEPAANTATTAEAQAVEATDVAEAPAGPARQRLAVFFFENESGDPALDWLQYTATELLTQDLQQDTTLSTSSPYTSQRGGMYGRLQAAGFEDGLGAPASLLRQIARDANRQYFTTGSIEASDDGFSLTTRLWETTSMKRVDEFTQTGWDILPMMDQASIRIREVLDAPSLQVSDQEDLPLAETYGESEDALRAYMHGLNARLLDNDITSAIGHFDQALAIDPNFVLALLYKGYYLTETGNMPAAAAAFTQAQPLDYRLPANDRAILTSMVYRTNGESEKLFEFLRLQVQLRDEAFWHAQLATLLMVDGDTEQARQHFQAALARDPLNVGLLLVLSDIERSLGNLDGALEYARRYQEERPDEMDAHIKLGDLLRDTGQLDQARAEYQKAQLLENRSVAPLLALQIIADRNGDYARSRQLLEEAMRIASTSGEKYSVHMAAHYLEARLGRIDAAIEQLRAAEPYLAESQPPFVVALSIHSTLLDLALRRDDIEMARAVVAEARAMLPAPPMSGFLEPLTLLVTAYEGDFDAARGHLDTFESTLKQLKYNAMNFQLPLLAGEIAYFEEDYASAATLLQSAVDQIGESFVAGQINAYALPILMAHVATAQMMADQLESAQLTLDQGLALDPSSPYLWLAQASLEARKGDPDRARELAGQVMQAWSDADPNLAGLEKARTLAEDGQAATAGQ